MLRFSCKPDHVLTTLINDSFELGMDALKIQKLEFNVHWLDKPTFKMFGSSTDILLKEMEKLYTANKSVDLFMPTDYHFKLLDKVIEWYCDIYNDSTDDPDTLIYVHGKPVEYLDIDDIRSSFFWDNDYELSDILDSQENPEETSAILEFMGVTQSGKNLQKGNLPDLGDLSLEMYTPDPDWEEVEDDFWFT